MSNPHHDTVALSSASALFARRRLRTTDGLHRPEPTEPPGPDDPDEGDDAPPDPDRLPGEPLPPPIGDPPPNYAPQSVRVPMPRDAHCAASRRVPEHHRPDRIDPTYRMALNGAVASARLAVLVTKPANFLPAIYVAGF
jgi:hypothetical protein